MAFEMQSWIDELVEQEFSGAYAKFHNTHQPSQSIEDGHFACRHGGVFAHMTEERTVQLLEARSMIPPHSMIY